MVKILLLLLVSNHVLYALEKININVATKEELMSLTQIGEELAEAIIAYRTTYGSFTTKEEIKKVSGIGERRYYAIEPYITVEEIKRTKDFFWKKVSVVMLIIFCLYFGLIR